MHGTFDFLSKPDWHVASHIHSCGHCLQPLTRSLWVCRQLCGTESSGIFSLGHKKKSSFCPSGDFCLLLCFSIPISIKQSELKNRNIQRRITGCLLFLYYTWILSLAPFFPHRVGITNFPWSFLFVNEQKALKFSWN